jgi:hypothetical protein
MKPRRFSSISEIMGQAPSAKAQWVGQAPRANAALAGRRLSGVTLVSLGLRRWSGSGLLLHHRLAVLLALALGHGLLAVVHHLGVVMASHAAMLPVTAMLLAMLCMTGVRVGSRSGLGSGGNCDRERKGAEKNLHAVISTRN